MLNNIDSVVREVTFNPPIERVWKAITCPKEIQHWFGSAASFELKQGELGYFEWEEESEGRFAIRIETVTAPNYFAWRWMFQQDTVFDEATSTLVEWSLTPSWWHPTSINRIRFFTDKTQTSQYRRMGAGISRFRKLFTWVITFQI